MTSEQVLAAGGGLCGSGRHVGEPSCVEGLAKSSCPKPTRWTHHAHSSRRAQPFPCEMKASLTNLRESDYWRSSQNSLKGEVRRKRDRRSSENSSCTSFVRWELVHQ